MPAFTGATQSALEQAQEAPVITKLEELCVGMHIEP